MTRREFVAGVAGAAFCGVAAGEAAEGEPVVGTYYNLSRLATHDGPGLRTVVFLKGCPLRCVWCHSPESWSYAIEHYPNGEVIGVRTTTAELWRQVARDRDFFETSGGGVTLSGGEPLAQAVFCTDFFARAKRDGVHTAIETSGFANWNVVERLIPLVDVWLWDVKLMDAAACLRHTGRPLAPVLGNLRRLDAALVAAGRGEIVLRCPMIPGINDDAAELRARGRLADELKSVIRLDVEPYVPYGIAKAHRLGLKVYEAPQPPAAYGPAKRLELAAFTRKPVAMG